MNPATPTSPAPPAFTAPEIAVAIGKSPQAIRERLAHVPETGFKNSGGPLAKAWSVDALPESLRSQIADAKNAAGFATFDEFLSARNQPWKLARPINEFPDDALRQAAMLMHGLRPSLDRRKSTLLTAAEKEAMGLKEHAAAFHRQSPISGRQFRSLMARTIERDRGAENWDRIELYLPDHPPRKAPADATSSAIVAGPEFSDLLEIMVGLSTPPTIQERNYLVERSFFCFEEQLDSGLPHIKAQKRILRFLLRFAPFLAKTKGALRAAWKRKYRAWVDGGRQLTALDDQRAKNSGRFRAPELTDDDHKILVVASVKYKGPNHAKLPHCKGINKAWRELLLARRLSAALCDYYASATRFCPALIRRRITPDVRLGIPSDHGPNSEKTQGPYIDRDWSATASGDFDQSDDMTMDNLWYDPIPDAFFFGVGQLLVWLDERSDFIYGCDLISASSYTGFSIRNSFTKKAETWGLPRKGLAFERGIWEKARLLKGRSTGTDIEFIQTEMGLSRLGLRLENATTARGKIIERVYGSLQDEMQLLPGYVGRNHLTDKYEKVQKQKALVEAGRAHPAEFGFLSKSEMMDKLAGIFLKYNDTPKHGKRHKGLTPRQAFEKYFTSPLTIIPDECRYLLASNKIPTTVGRNGISFQFGRERFIYKNLRTGQLRGQRVIAWFNPENPQTLSVTDMNSENPFVVSRATSVAAHDPPPGQLEQAMRENAQHMAYPKELNRSLKPYYNDPFFQNMFRIPVVGAQELDNQAEFSRQEQVIESERVTLTDTRRAYRDIGAPVPTIAGRPAGDPVAARRLAELLNEVKSAQ